MPSQIAVLWMLLLCSMGMGGCNAPAPKPPAVQPAAPVVQPVKPPAPVPVPLPPTPEATPGGVPLTPAPVPAPAPPAASAALMLIEERPAPGSPGGMSVSVYSRSGGKRLLTSDGMSPNWTPDGRVSFSRSDQVWIMAADGSGARQIGSLSGTLTPLMPQIGRNGTIVFAGAAPLDGDGNPTIWAMQSDGSGLREVTHGMQPFLAASGTWLTYTLQTQNPQHREIWRINPDGSGKTQITFLGDPDYPDANASNISPDESMVAFFSGTEAVDDPTKGPDTWGYRNVAVVPANGGPRRTLTTCQPMKMNATMTCLAADNPAWFPDGQSLIFDVGWKDHGDTWAIGLNGQNFRKFYSASRGTVRVPLR